MSKWRCSECLRRGSKKNVDSEGCRKKENWRWKGGYTRRGREEARRHICGLFFTAQRIKVSSVGSMLIVRHLARARLVSGCSCRMLVGSENEYRMASPGRKWPIDLCSYSVNDHKVLVLIPLRYPPRWCSRMNLQLKSWSVLLNSFQRFSLILDLTS